MRRLEISFLFLVTISSVGAAGCAKVSSEPEEPRFTVTTDRAEIPADGRSKTIVTAFLLDPSGAPTKYGSSVIFMTTDGILKPAIAPVIDGKVSTTLTSGLNPGSVVINVRAEPEGLLAETKIQFTAPISSSSN